LYQQHAVGLIRLAVIMLGDRAAAEDVVQEAFFGLYRNWFRLGDPANVRRPDVRPVRHPLRRQLVDRPVVRAADRARHCPPGHADPAADKAAALRRDDGGLRIGP
jgi:DNA-directed RNA polymerase specialized sigma24 family protein